MNGDASRSGPACACGDGGTTDDVVPVVRMIHVVAGALIDADGRVLLAQRPPGKHLAGYWEFPGGKVEPGESAQDALRRELREEIGVEVESAEPLIRVPWHYGEKSILLDAYVVRGFRGEPASGEGQALRWVPLDALDRREMPPADHPVITALQLPDVYLITPEPQVGSEGEREAFLARLQSALDRGIRLVQLRAKQLPREVLRELALAAQARVRAAGARMLLNGDIELVRELGLDGVHLSSAQLASLSERPLPRGFWVSASCHDADELHRAARLDVDFAVLGPVQATSSHPQASPLGWDRFAGLVSSCPLPVYALGGMLAKNIAASREASAHGIAGISGLW